MKCAVCKKPMPFTAKGLIGPQKCQDCVVDEIPVRIVGDIELPDHVKRSIKELKDKLKTDLKDKNGKIVEAEIVAMRGDAIDDDSDMGKRLRILAAREAFQVTSGSFAGLLHLLRHAGVKDSELKAILKRWVNIQAELISDYLFIGQEARFDVKDKLQEKNYRCVFHCDEDEED